MQLYLAPWTWYTERPNNPYWAAPARDRCKGFIDLCSLAGGTPEGYGLFVYPDVISSISAYSIGTETDTLGTTAKEKIANALKLTKPIVASKPLSILWELLNNHADISGLLRWKPLRPGVDLKLKLYLGGFSLIREERFDPGLHPLVIPSVQEGYRKIRRECLAAGSDHYKRVLSALEAKYRLPYKTFIPADLPDEGKLSHRTTITDNFNRADADALGTSSEGWSWVEDLNDMDIVTNRVQTMSNGLVMLAKANQALAGDDHYAQLAINNLGGGANFGPAARYAYAGAGADTDYLGLIDATNFLTVKRISGNQTILSTVATTFVTDALAKIQADGSTITSWYNGVQKWTGTDTGIVDNLVTAMFAYEDGSLGDNFEAADLVVAVGQGAKYHQMNGITGINMFSAGR